MGNVAHVCCSNFSYPWRPYLLDDLAAVPKGFVKETGAGVGKRRVIRLSFCSILIFGKF